MSARSSLRLTPRRLFALLFALAVPVAATSCQSIAGIDERELGPCGHFCDVVTQNCSGAHRVYENRDKCMAVCKTLDLGDANEWQGKDTLECRLHEAELAATDSDEELDKHCRSAGPEGLSCGGACENYCTLYEHVCGQTQCGSHDACVTKCAALRDRGAYDVVEDYEGNSLQCRLVHLSNGSIIDGGGPHCGHANLSTPTDHCNDLPEAASGTGGAAAGEPDSVKPPAPNCEDYCRVISVSCGEEQYESKTQCLKLCPLFPVGEFADTNQNTLGCRIYHSYNALCSPAAHCPHAGMSGEGHCGTDPTDKCKMYCTLAQSVCGKEYDAAFESEQACLDACAYLPDHEPTDDGDTRYSVAYATANPNTVACRFLALARAAEKPALCATKSAFGEADCAAE